MKTCPICKDQNATIHYQGDTCNEFVNCPRCSDYSIHRYAKAYFEANTFTERQRANISGWLRDNPDYFISDDKTDFLKSLKTPSFHERVDKLLMQFERESDYAGDRVKENKSWLSAGWCLNQSELEEFILFLHQEERILDTRTVAGGGIKISSNGWAHLEELKKINADMKQGFVAMWFDKDMDSIYNDVISKAILDAGYKPHRVDKREHVDRIDDEIIAQIKKSRFVLADFTGHRGGVYYEAGYAHGLGLNVFMTCLKDDSKLHFDIQQYNCIFWESDKLCEFRKAITNRIEAVIGHGTYKETE